MPISKKISEEMEHLNIENTDKEFLMKILKMEDGGLRNFMAPYEREIKEYLEQNKEEVE